MIRLPLLTTLQLLLALPTQAARLELADNLTLLASSRGKASPFERALTLPPARPAAGTLRQPARPRLHQREPGTRPLRPAAADPDPAGQRHLRLVTPPLPTPQAIRHFATHPSLRLETPRVCPPVGNHLPVARTV
jgi:hypothetical protein